LALLFIEAVSVMLALGLREPLRDPVDEVRLTQAAVFEALQVIAVPPVF
jgi:hypothetical protein